MCHGLESIMFGTSESAPCPRGRVKYIPLCAFTASKGGFCHSVFSFFFAGIFQLKKARRVQKSSPSHAYLFQTSSQDNIVLVACESIGSGHFQFNQKSHCAATCQTENANYVICRDVGEEEKTNEIIK